MLKSDVDYKVSGIPVRMLLGVMSTPARTQKKTCSTFFSYLFVYIFHTYLQSCLAPVHVRCRHPCIFEVEQGAENERKRVKFHI